VRIDHVIYAAADLDAAAARIEGEFGLMAGGGGRHDGLGTCNRVVPLGGGYLELLGVADSEEAARSEFGRGVLARLAPGGDGLLGWVVAVDDVDSVARRLGTDDHHDQARRAKRPLDRLGRGDAGAVPAVLHQP
jgi:hypothetical protein